MHIAGIKLSSADMLTPGIRRYLDVQASTHGRWAPIGGGAEYDTASTEHSLVFSWPYDLLTGTLPEVVAHIAGRPDNDQARWRGVYLHKAGELDRDAGRLVEVEAVLTWDDGYTYLFLFEVPDRNYAPTTLAVARWLA